MPRVSAKWIYCRQEGCICAANCIFAIFPKYLQDIYEDAPCRKLYLCQDVEHQYLPNINQLLSPFQGRVCVIFLLWGIFFSKRLRQLGWAQGSDRRGFEFLSLPVRGLTIVWRKNIKVINIPITAMHESFARKIFKIRIQKCSRSSRLNSPG